MPQPVEFPGDVSRTLAAERVQTAMERGVLAGQQRAAQEQDENQLINENTVHDTPEAQSEEVDEELKRRTPYDERRRKKKAKAEEDEKKRPPAKAPGEGNSLDVRV